MVITVIEIRVDGGVWLISSYFYLSICASFYIPIFTFIESVEAKDLASPHPPKHHLQPAAQEGKAGEGSERRVGRRWGTSWSLENCHHSRTGKGCPRGAAEANAWRVQRPPAQLLLLLLQLEIHFQFVIFFQLPELINLGDEQLFLLVLTDRKSFIKGARAGHHGDLWQVEPSSLTGRPRPPTAAILPTLK